jgi:RNA recognition motif-containing protein
MIDTLLTPSPSNYRTWDKEATAYKRTYKRASPLETATQSATVLDPMYKHPIPEKPSGTTICIKNLPDNTTNDELRPFVELFGTVEVISVARNIYTGDQRHFGFVRFESKNAARRAAKILANNMVLRGKRLNVSISNKW